MPRIAPTTHKIFFTFLTNWIRTLLINPLQLLFTANLTGTLCRRSSTADGSPEDTETDAPCSPDKSRADLLAKTNNNKRDNERKSQESTPILPGVPHIPASEIFEIGWVAGTEDRYVELIFARMAKHQSLSEEAHTPRMQGRRESWLGCAFVSV